MKKTNKTFKRFAAITSASLLAACAVAPVAFNAFAAPSTIEITNTNTDAAVHNYEAYQIFEGVMSDNKLTEIKWGTGIDISKEAELLEALAAKNTQFAKNLVTYTIAESATDIQTAFGTWNTENGGGKEVKDYYDYLKGESGDTTGITITCDAKSAEKIADVLATVNDNDQLAKDFAEVVSKYLSTVAADKTLSHVVTADEDANDTYGTTYVENDVIIPGLDDGYYLIQDAAGSPGSTVSGDNSGAKTRFILKVTDNDTITINAKSAAPTVNKQVWDNEGGENGTWDETADWNINDKYLKNGEQQAGFKLIANIPANVELKSYESYKLIFNDDMSAGVSFDNIRSVKVIAEIDEETVETVVALKTTNAAGYEYTTADANGEWTLTINDLTKFMPEGATWGETALTVEVIYNAHLNNSALWDDTSNTPNGEVYNEGNTANVNNNNVYLQYSNNPNWEGSGSGIDEEFGQTKDDTVGVFTYKITNTKYANSVGNGNELPNAEFKLYSDSACTIEIPLSSVLGNNDINYYIPAEAGATGVTMKSQSDGTFNIIGLDAGTYYIREEKAPEGFNKIKEPKEIVITATHSESDDGANAILDLGSSAMNYTYENKQGTQLPGTGGIGTTIFYLGGGAMAAIGGIYLISKRRMRKSEE